MAQSPPDPRMIALGKNLAAVSGQFNTPRPSPPPLVKTRGTHLQTKGDKHEKSD